MKNIHILPTDKPSRIFFNDGELCLRYSMSFKEGDKPQNIYITSNEEIKDGYVKHIEYRICKVLSIKTAFIECETSTGVKMLHPTHCKKIILTTDQELINDGVQAIDDEFLERYVKNPNFDTVDVHKIGDKYLYIIPKEEPKDFLGRTETDLLKQEAIAEEMGEFDKQETAEEAANRLWKINNEEGIVSKNSFIKGAKWQAERMYSEEEVRNLIAKFHIVTDGTKKFEDKWFEQNKKK
jgi:hypothetical protein